MFWLGHGACFRPEGHVHIANGKVEMFAVLMHHLQIRWRVYELQHQIHRRPRLFESNLVVHKHEKLSPGGGTKQSKPRKASTQKS